MYCIFDLKQKTNNYTTIHTDKLTRVFVWDTKMESIANVHRSQGCVSIARKLSM